MKGGSVDFKACSIRSGAARIEEGYRLRERRDTRKVVPPTLRRSGASIENTLIDPRAIRFAQSEFLSLDGNNMLKRY